MKKLSELCLGMVLQNNSNNQKNTSENYTILQEVYDEKGNLISFKVKYENGRTEKRPINLCLSDSVVLQKPINTFENVNQPTWLDEKDYGPLGKHPNKNDDGHQHPNKKY